jgi:hypothetical protein
LSVVIIKAEYSGVEAETFFIPGEIIFPSSKKKFQFLNTVAVQN